MRSFLLLIIVLSCCPAFAQNSHQKSKLDSIAVSTINETFNDKLYKWESKFIIEQMLINILQKSNEKTLSEIKITIEYKDENAVPFDYTHGAILGLEKLGFHNTICTIDSWICSHEIVFDNRPKFILKHIPSRVRKYIKVAEPDIWNLASESIFHTSIN